MSLYINWDEHALAFNKGPLVKRQREWHYGEAVPVIGARVVSFQADGDELAYIMECLRRTCNSREIPDADVAKKSHLPYLEMSLGQDALIITPRGDSRAILRSIIDAGSRPPDNDLDLWYGIDTKAGRRTCAVDRYVFQIYSSGNYVVIPATKAWNRYVR